MGQTVSVMLFFPYAGCHSFKILPILGERDCKIALTGAAGCRGKKKQQLVMAMLGEAEVHWQVSSPAGAVLMCKVQVSIRGGSGGACSSYSCKT